MFREVRSKIDSADVQGLGSDGILAEVAEGLEGIGFEVESGKHAAQKIRRPVLFGPQGIPRVTYEVDGAHDDLGIVFEIEAGRG